MFFNSVSTAWGLVGNFSVSPTSSPSLYFPRLVIYASNSAATSAAALALDGQDALQRGGGDAQPLGHGNVVLHGLGDGMSAHHQHPGAPEQVAANVDAALVLLGNRVIEEKGQEQGRADGGKARIIDGAAILRGKLRVFAVAAVPCGGDVSKGSFHSRLPPIF